MAFQRWIIFWFLDFCEISADQMVIMLTLPKVFENIEWNSEFIAFSPAARGIRVFLPRLTRSELSELYQISKTKRLPKNIIQKKAKIFKKIPIKSKKQHV